MKIKIADNGPYLVEGNIPLYREIMVKYKMIIPLKWEKVEKFETKERYALCRCGLSANKPFCDGSHSQGFDGEKTAENIPFEKLAKKYEGENFDLSDAKPLCASARFCLRQNGIWKLIKERDEEKIEIVKEEAWNCPSGRLVLIDKEGNPVEPALEKEISILEDNLEGVSGPIWVKGGIPVESSKGFTYEIRNRVTLCRCGKSANKPFCDGNHIKIKFKDEKYYKE
jgi:CDGSH-type Zn-finger protein